MHVVDLGLRRLLLAVGACGLAALSWPPVFFGFLLGSVFSPLLAALCLTGPILFLVAVLNAPQGNCEAIGLPMLGAIGGSFNIVHAFTARAPLWVGF